jgi:hypothetical protein
MARDVARVRERCDDTRPRRRLRRRSRPQPNRDDAAGRHGRVFTQIDNITSARRIRLHLATGLVPGVVWAALYAGAILTVGFPLFFGSENLPAQITMTGVLSILVTLGLVVIISIDYPFTGPVHVQPEPLSAVLAEIAS